MKARDAIHRLESDPKFVKSKYYSQQLAKALLDIPDYELREMVQRLKSADLDWDLERFVSYISEAPGCARIKLLLEKLLENSCCSSHFTASLLAGIITHQMDLTLGPEANTSLH